jgi:hypothetical protein
LPAFFTLYGSALCSNIELSCGIRSMRDHTRRGKVKQG